MTAILEADVSMAPETFKGLQAAVGNAVGLLVTTLSGVVIVKVRSVGWTAEEMAADLRERTGDENIHLVLDVEEA